MSTVSALPSSRRGVALIGVAGMIAARWSAIEVAAWAAGSGTTGSSSVPYASATISANKPSRAFFNLAWTMMLGNRSETQCVL